MYLIVPHAGVQQSHTVARKALSKITDTTVTICATPSADWHEVWTVVHNLPQRVINVDVYITNTQQDNGISYKAWNIDPDTKYRRAWNRVYKLPDEGTIIVSSDLSHSNSRDMDWANIANMGNLDAVKRMQTQDPNVKPCGTPALITLLTKVGTPLVPRCIAIDDSGSPRHVTYAAVILHEGTPNAGMTWITAYNQHGQAIGCRGGEMDGDLLASVAHDIREGRLWTRDRQPTRLEYKQEGQWAVAHDFQQEMDEACMGPYVGRRVVAGSRHATYIPEVNASGQQLLEKAGITGPASYYTISYKKLVVPDSALRDLLILLKVPPTLALPPTLPPALHERSWHFHA
jgi:hypothetical protein